MIIYVGDYIDWVGRVNIKLFIGVSWGVGGVLSLLVMFVVIRGVYIYIDNYIIRGNMICEFWEIYL